MKRRLLLPSFLGAAALIPSGLGCGDDGVACGEGTVESAGACVPSSMVTCADGTVLRDGRCVFDDANCPPGTSFDEATRACVADLAECAPGTVAMGRTCVPDGSVICADNTTYDPETGVCVVTSEACAEGTTLVDGACVPDDETLVAEVTAAPEPNDPFLANGTPGSFMPPAIGEERTVDGCITPADFDGDGEIDIDLDAFDFTVDGPGLYRIRADGLGGLAAGFAVVTKDVLPNGTPFIIRQGFGERGFARLGLNFVGDSSERRVFLPGAGSYQLVIFDSRSIDLSRLFFNNQSFTLPVGSEDTCYFVTVERELLPEPTTISIDEPVRGDFDEPAFFRASVAERSLIDVLIEVLPPEPGRNEIAPAVVRIADDEFAAELDYGFRAFSPIVPAGETVLVVVDTEFDISFDSREFELELTRVPSVPEDGVLTAVQPPGDFLDFGSLAWFEAEAGDVVRLSFGTAGFPVRLGVTDVLNRFSVVPPCGLFGCPEDVIFYRVPFSGTQIVDVANPSVDAGAEFDVSFAREARTPVSPALGVLTTVPLVGERTFLNVDPGSSPWTVVELSSFAGTGFTSADVGFHGDSAVTLADPPALAAPAVTFEVGLIHGRSGGRPTLVEVSDPAGFDGDETVDVRVQAETFADLRVDPVSPVFRPGDEVPAGGPAYYFVRAVPTGEVTFEVTGADGTDPVVQQLDAVTGVVDSADVTGADGTETLTATVGDAGWLAFAVRAGDVGGSVEVSVTHAPLPAFTYTQRPGDTSFASVCPSAGGDGAKLLDGMNLIDARELSTLSGFEFFGVPVTEVQVSTSGWLTVDSSYEGGAFLSPFGFDGPFQPFSVVAALVDNDLEAEVCILEGSDRLVVEWRGSPDGGVGTVEMQAILRSDGDTVEVLYGGGHDVVDGIVGLKSPDGLTRASSVLSVKAGTSILFTPLP